MTFFCGSIVQVQRLSYTYVRTYNALGEQKESALAPSSASFLLSRYSTYSCNFSTQPEVF